MKYRLLLPDEYPRLYDILPPDCIPSPETSVVAIAEDNQGNIVGVLPLQLRWHLGPWSSASADVSFESLKETIDKQLRDFPGSCYYSLVESDKAAKLAERSGMKLKPSLVFLQEVN